MGQINSIEEQDSNSHLSLVPPAPEELTAQEKRDEVAEVLGQNVLWQTIEQTLRQNNGEEAEHFMAELRQIDPNASEAQKTDQLMAILKEYSEHTVTHSKLMKELVAKLENSHGFDLSGLAEASERHDIGKLAMPDRLLNFKGGEYNEEANRIKESHSAVGHLILRALKFDERSTRLALTHHLKYKTQDDGKVVVAGYPVDQFLEYCEKKGQEPKLTDEDQLVAFTDVFSALMDASRPNDRFGTHNTEISMNERCQKAFAIMDSKIFNDPYYLNGEGNSLYSSFKDAMLDISEHSSVFKMAA